jgi:hypothetical protein
MLQPHFEASVGWNSHSQKWELEVPSDSQKLIAWLQGSKHLALRCSLYCWKGLEVWMSKMASHEPFRHLQHKLWSKEKPVRLLTTKSRKSTWSRYVQVESDTPLESSWGEPQVCFRPHPNRRFELGVMSFQSPGSPNRDNFGTPPWESRNKKPFRCRCHGQMKRILYGGRWWLPPSPGRGESSESVLPVACPNTDSGSECGLTNLLVGFDAWSSN